MMSRQRPMMRIFHLRSKRKDREALPFHTREFTKVNLMMNMPLMCSFISPHMKPHRPNVSVKLSIVIGGSSNTVRFTRHQNHNHEAIDHLRCQWHQQSPF
jgi:hypothetical protein